MQYEGLIPRMFISIHPNAWIYFFSTCSRSSSLVLLNVKEMITCKVLSYPKYAYFRCARSVFNSRERSSSRDDFVLAVSRLLRFKDSKVWSGVVIKSTLSSSFPYSLINATKLSNYASVEFQLSYSISSINWQDSSLLGYFNALKTLN